jgi:UDP-N-acetyl-D-glucosamine dehydrogenase
MKIAVIGQGYVGLPLAVRAAESGHAVVGYDVDAAKIDQLLAGRSPVEDVSHERLNAVLSAKTYTPTGISFDIDSFDVAVITVPTPLCKDGKPNLGFVRSASWLAGRHLREGATVILESTVAPGTTRDIVLPALEQESGLEVGQFYLAFSPERIDPGNPTWHFENTPKIVAGYDEESSILAGMFYRMLGVPTVRAYSLEAAELAKIIENTQRDVNIALVNEMTRYAHVMGIDIHDALRVAATKPYGYMSYSPGPGVGGHCLPIDTIYLAHQARETAGTPLLTVELARAVNDAQPAYVVDRLEELLAKHGQKLDGARVGVFGYAYKKGTADARETPARGVVEALLDRFAKVAVYDSLATVPDDLRARMSELPFTGELDKDLDAIVIVTDHDQADYDRLAEIVADSKLIVLDTRNRMAAYRSDRIEMI